MSENRGDSSMDIYQLLVETSKKQERKERTQLLQSIEVNEYFDEGSVQIDKTCRGIECRLCIRVCPTNALYWKMGEIGIVKELCVFCTACVGVCIVDNCILVSRKRPSGEIERFSNPRETVTLLNNVNSRKVVERIKSLFPWA